MIEQQQKNPIADVMHNNFEIVKCQPLQNISAEHTIFNNDSASGIQVVFFLLLMLFDMVMGIDHFRDSFEIDSETMYWDNGSSSSNGIHRYNFHLALSQQKFQLFNINEKLELFGA